MATLNKGDNDIIIIIIIIITKRLVVIFIDVSKQPHGLPSSALTIFLSFEYKYIDL